MYARLKACPNDEQYQLTSVIPLSAILYDLWLHARGAFLVGQMREHEPQGPLGSLTRRDKDMADLARVYELRSVRGDEGRCKLEHDLLAARSKWDIRAPGMLARQ